MSRPITAAQYYELLPGMRHQCGDIWTGIKTLGLLGDEPVSGVVVTPACDLDNRKTETVTFLPIVPLRAFFSTTSILPEIRRAVSGALASLTLEHIVTWDDYEFRPPLQSNISAAIHKIDKRLQAKNVSHKDTAALNRARAGLKIVEAIRSPNLVAVPHEQLRALFTKWNELKEKIIRNSHSAFLHFLPADGQRQEFSGIPAHSVVMFRYPITVPIDVLDLAGQSAESNWSSVVKANLDDVPYLAHYSNSMPMKKVSLKSEFLADLLSRYVAVYNRIGSPDFTAAAIGRIASEVDA